ncbi:MAG: hypothetical protein IJL27_06110 [Firmicutes bacterium]|nr:hypothetical protein [Bacillota bacterium]
MKKRIRLAALLTAAAMLLVLLSGCIDAEFGVRFGEDGRVSFSMGTYIAQSFFDVTGKTPQEHFQEEIEAGGVLESRTYSGEQYWGIRPEPRNFSTLEEFKAAAADIDRVTVTTENYGNSRQYAKISLEVPAKSQALAESGAGSDPNGLLDKMVTNISISFPGGVIDYNGAYSVEVSEDGKDLTAVLYPRNEAFTFSAGGYLSDNYICVASLRVGDVMPGLTPSDIAFKVSSPDLDERLDIEGASASWSKVAEGGRRDPMASDSVFERGGTYALEYKVPVRQPYLVSEDVTLFIGAENNTGKYIGTDGKGDLVFQKTFEIAEDAPMAVSQTPVQTGTSQPGASDPSQPELPPLGPGQPEEAASPREGISEPAVPFTDVSADAYYMSAVIWAFNSDPQITDGTTPTSFSPARTCTNAHILTFIYRYAGEPQKSGLGPWWQDALDFAEREGLTAGSYDGAFDEQADCTRANVVYFLYLLADKA